MNKTQENYDLITKTTKIIIFILYSCFIFLTSYGIFELSTKTENGILYLHLGGIPSSILLFIIYFYSIFLYFKQKIKKFEDNNPNMLPIEISIFVFLIFLFINFFSLFLLWR